MYGKTDGLTDMEMEGKTDEQSDIRADGRSKGWTEGMDRYRNEGTDARKKIDGLTDTRREGAEERTH